MNLSRRFFLLMGGSALIASACTGGTQSHDQSLASESKNVKQVTHAFGETEVPATPSRVIVWGYTTIEAVVAHGVQPIGVPDGIANEMVHLSLDEEAVVEIGNPGQPNLEAMAALKPDLILTSRYRVHDAYPLLAQIAPTVVLDIDSNAEWKELTRLCGDVLGKSTETERLAAAYEAKLQRVKAQLSQQATQPQVSVVSLFPGRIGTLGTETFAGSVLADAGVARPPNQSQAQGPQDLSLEALDQLDGDVIFIVGLQGSTEAATAARAERDRVQAHPLWAQLKAVQANQAYEIGPYWMIGSYIAANLILDDLLTYMSR